MKTIFLIGCFFTALNCYSQAKETTIEIAKIIQPAATVEMAIDAAIVDDAINEHMTKKGRVKGKSVKGFNSYINASATDSMGSDLYFKVERKSKKEKQASTIHLIMFPKNKSIDTPASSAELNTEQAITYLNQLIPTVEAYHLEEKIRDQNNEVKKAESKFVKLVSDGEGYVKDKAKIEQKIADNKLSQEKQTAEIEKQKLALTALVNERKL